jgi:hypothetical protein
VHRDWVGVCTVVGVGHLATTLIFSSSMLIPSGVILIPMKEVEVVKKSHFWGLRNKWCVVTQQAVNNKSYNYPPNYSIFPEVIRDTFASRDLGVKVVTFAYVRSG